MAITKSKEISKIEPFASGYDNDSSAWVHEVTDISGEDVSVQAICNTAWTDAVKANYKTHKESS